MLNYRNTFILFIVLNLALIIGGHFIVLRIWYFVGIVLVLITLFTLGSIRIKMNFYLVSHCSGDRNRKAVAFTFDDGPDRIITPMVLDVLKKQGIEAGFFVIGSKVMGNPELVKRMDREGHIIGGHSFSHLLFFDLLSSRKMKEELILTRDMILQVTGRRTKFFRPPYGVTNPALARTVRILGLQSIGWSLKSRDTVIDDKDFLLSRLTRKVKPGDVILFHDTKELVPEVLSRFILFLREAGFEIIRPDRLLNIEAYEQG
jgi:peptidoglycan/xylan/chitin deacetylase (PgdA/CDA1 family)